MNEALQKSLVLVLLIIIGYTLRGRYKSKEMVNGVKELVLTIALPATIFTALMKIPLDRSLLIVPLITIVFNLYIFYIIPPILNFFTIEKDSPIGRTILMLMPSLAPGLSCFPFVAEFLGQKSLAMAAMADVGNKIFVLIFLYIFALNLFLKQNKEEKSDLGTKIKSLLISLVKEPINSIIFLAIGLLSFGIGYDTLPSFVTDIFDKTSAMMTPLILMFIGLAVELKQKKKRIIVSLLMFRAGVSLVFSCILIMLLGLNDPNLVLLAVVVPLSSASFWPFAHISLFNLKEEKLELSKEKRTFNMEFAVLFLAFSLPFSSGLILTVLSFGHVFTHLWAVLTLGIILIVSSIAPFIFSRIHLKISNPIPKN